MTGSSGSAIEKLFIQIFERKLSIFQQVKQQTDLFDQSLASKCLLDGFAPPPFLLSPSLSSFPHELNKEELISGLLLPRPQPGRVYSATHYALKDPVVTLNNVELPDSLYTEVNKGFDAGDRFLVLPEVLGKDDVQVQYNLNAVVPGVDASVTSPQDCRDVGTSDNLPDYCQSLARIQRSKSRQRALELRNSGKEGKTSSRGGHNVGASTSRFRGDGVTSLQFDCAEQSEFVKPVDANSNIGVEEGAQMDECRVKENSNDTYNGKNIRCRSRQSSSSANEPSNVHYSTYVAKEDDLTESINKAIQQADHVNELSEVVPVEARVSCAAEKENLCNLTANEMGSSMHCCRISSSRSLSPQPNSTKQPLDVNNTSYVEKEDSRLKDTVDGSSQQPHCANEISELVKTTSIISTKSYGGVKEKVSDNWSKEKGSNVPSGGITRSRSLSRQPDCMKESSKLNGSSGNANEEPELKTMDSGGLLAESSGKSSQAQPPKLVEKEGDFLEVFGTQSNTLPCIESDNMVDQDIGDVIVAETSMDSDGLVGACSVSSRSDSKSASLGVDVFVSRLSTGCAMVVKPKQLDFDDVENCSLNEISDPALENRKQSMPSEKRASTLLYSTGTLDKVFTDYGENPNSSPGMPFLEEQEISSKGEKSWDDLSETFVRDSSVLVDENATIALHKKAKSAISQHQNSDAHFMGSWPQYKRRKIVGQLNHSLCASPIFMRKLFQPIYADHENGNMTSVEGYPDTVHISESFYIYQKGQAVQPNVINISVKDGQKSEPQTAGPEFSSPELQVEEVEPGLETRSRSLNKLGARSLPSLTKPSTGVSESNLFEEAPGGNPIIVVFDETVEQSAKQNQVSLQLEDRFELGHTELLTGTATMQERTFHLGGDGNSPCLSVGSPHSQSMDLPSADQSMPVYEWFGIETEGINLDKLDLSDTALESAIAMERLCKSVCLQTPLSHFSTESKRNKALNIYQSVPNGVLEGMELRTTVNTNDNSGNQLEANSSFFMGEVNGILQGQWHSDSPASSTGPTWEVKKPYISPIGKIWEGIRSKSLSSEKRSSSIPDLPCISEENENTVEPPDTFQAGIGSEQMTSSVKREPLADITKCSNPQLSVYESDIISDRCSLASVNTEFSFTGTCKGDKHGNQKGNRRKYTSKAKEKQSISRGINGIKRANESHYNSKLKLSGKTSLRKEVPSLAERVSKSNNIVSNVSSFIPLVQQKQAAAVITGKRDVKVKALEAAEAAKRLAEKKENERKMKKEALKLERAKIEEQNLRQLELEKEKKEQERKRKEADLAAKKIQREEGERKEKERKRKRVEETRRQQLLHEEKLRAEKEEREIKRRAADERAFGRKESKDQSGKYGYMEKEKGDNNLQEVRESAPVTTLVSTIDDRKSSIVPEDSKVLGDDGDNPKEMSTFPMATVSGTLTSNINQEQSYEISPYKGSDDEDEDEDDDDDDDLENSKFIPSWASKNHLALIVSSQQQISPESVFPPESFCNIDEVLLPRKLQQKQWVQQ